MSKTKKDNKAVTERMYEIIKTPVVTEKAMKNSEFGHVVFRVPVSATKTEVKKAVEAVFGVKVESVNTIRGTGKVKKFRGYIGQRSDYKKAIVKLAEGQNIDVTMGV